MILDLPAIENLPNLVHHYYKPQHSEKKLGTNLEIEDLETICGNFGSSSA